MHTFRKPPVLSLVLVTIATVGTLMIVGCPTSVVPGVNEVFMRSIAFDPAEITINIGESITWTNMDIIIPHTATSGNPGDVDFGSVFRSALLSQGESWHHCITVRGGWVFVLDRCLE